MSDENSGHQRLKVEPGVEREPSVATIALGSNLGPREAHLEAARKALAKTAGVEVLACSRVYQTPPVGPPGQGPYLNAVIRLRTRLGERALLERMLAIERERGRARSAAERWAARTLDLDLLLYGDHCIDEPDLIIPHPRLHERAFVLIPLCDVAATERHPQLDRRFDELASDTSDRETITLSPWQFGDPLPG